MRQPNKDLRKMFDEILKHFSFEKYYSRLSVYHSESLRVQPLCLQPVFCSQCRCYRPRFRGFGQVCFPTALSESQLPGHDPVQSGSVNHLECGRFHCHFWRAAVYTMFHDGTFFYGRHSPGNGFRPCQRRNRVGDFERFGIFVWQHCFPFGWTGQYFVVNRNMYGCLRRCGFMVCLSGHKIRKRAALKHF